MAVWVAQTSPKISLLPIFLIDIKSNRQLVGKIELGKL